jgi:hypothetical protein
MDAAALGAGISLNKGHGGQMAKVGDKTALSKMSEQSTHNGDGASSSATEDNWLNGGRVQ